MSTLGVVRTFDANPPSFTTGGQSRLQNPFGISYSSPLVPRQPASYENLDSDAWTAPMSAALLEPASIQTTIEQTLLTGNQFMTQTILPLQVTDKIQMQWTKFVFKPYLPNKMPYYSVARFVKGETESREAALVRVGLGFTLEQNFMATRLGQIFYLQHMKQISQAFLEQLQADAIIALLDADMWVKDKTGRRDATGRAYVDQAGAIMEREVALWNYMQKTKNAWANLNRWVDGKVGLYSQEKLTTWITDHRVTGFRDHVPFDQTQYFIHGPGNQDNIRRGIQYVETDALGNAVYCTRGFRIDDRPEFNPLESLQQTGEFYMGVDLPTTDYTIYTTRDRSISIYNEDLDSMAMISLDQMIDNCQRFNKNGDLLQTNQLPRNNGGDLSDLDQDFLYHKINGTVVPKNFFGQLKRAHFTEKDKLNLGESVCTALKMNMSSAQIGVMLKELISCVKVIANTPVTEENIRAWRDRLATNPRDALPEFFVITPEVVATDAGLPGAIAALNWPLPLTHATYRGFKEIERQANAPATNALLRQAFSSTYIDIIQKNMPLFDIYVQTLDGMFPGCALLHPSGASNIIQPTMYDVAFENLIRRDLPFLPFAIGNAKEIPAPTAANRAYIAERVNGIRDIFGSRGVDVPSIFGNYSDTPSINYLATLISSAAFFVALDKDQSAGNGTSLNANQAVQAHNNATSSLSPNFDVNALRSFVAAYNGVPELAVLRGLILTTLVTATSLSLVLSPLGVKAASAIPGRQNVVIPDNAQEFLVNASRYEDRFNGASVDVENLPLIVNLRANEGSPSPATTPAPPSTTFSSSSSASFSRRPTAVGAFANRQARDFIPTATSYASSERTTVNPKIDDINNTLTEDFRGHYTEACRRFNSTPQYLFPVLLFLFTKITKFSVSASAHHGFWHPFDYIVVRPHMLYSTLSAIKTIPGSATGNTFIGQVTANVANDNQTDETMVHIAGWTGAIVTGENRTFTATNILVTKYHKGNGIGVITPSEYNPSQGVFGATNDASLMFFAQPRNERYGKSFSISGELSMTDVFGQSVGVYTSDNKQWSFSSAPFYNRVFGFNQWNWKGQVRGLTAREVIKPNHIVYASGALYWNQIAREYTVATVNTGHWDSKLVGPGKSDERVGAAALTESSILLSATQANLSCIY